MPFPRPARIVTPLLVLSLAAPAQYRERKVSPGPRALGVIVWGYSPGDMQDASANKSPVPWLVPITVWEGQKLWDAEIYKASPRPMALEAEVLYEGFRAGESLGQFTVSEPTRIRRSWFSDGRWRTNAEIEASAARRKEAAKPPAEILAADEPPRLRRGGSPPPPAPKPAPKPEPKPETPAAPKEPPPKLGDTVVAISDAKSPPPQKFNFELKSEERERMLRLLQQRATEAIAKYVAEHNFVASAGIPEFEQAPPVLQRRPGGKAPAPARPKAAPPKSAKSAAPTLAAPQLDDVALKYFDVDNDNFPELILTASKKQLVGPRDSSLERTLFVTLVARADLDPGAREPLRTLLLYVTDSARLEQAPRLLFLDVVDADGDGVGELLFRTAGNPHFDQDLSTWTFQLFRAGADKLQLMFNSGSFAF